MREPRLPNPTMPRVRPLSTVPIPRCHPPARTRASLAHQRARRRQNQRPGEFYRPRDPVPADSTAHDDPEFPRGIDVDGCVRRPRRHQQSQIRQSLQDRSRERSALPHRGDDVEVLDPADQRIGVGNMVAKDRNFDRITKRGPVCHLEGHALKVIEHGNTIDLLRSNRLCSHARNAACSASRTGWCQGTMFAI